MNAAYERLPSVQQGGQAIIAVLVDDDHLNLFKRLLGDCGEHALQLRGTPNRRDHQRNDDSAVAWLDHSAPP